MYAMTKVALVFFPFFLCARVVMVEVVVMVPTSSLI